MALLLLALAFGARLYKLGSESLWYDELVSVDLARAPLMDLIAQTARDIHPPGYYLLLHFWQRLSVPIMEQGYSFEFLYAYPGLFMGIILCALTYWLARIYLGIPTGLIALLLVALHPFQIEYSQEVRMYTLGAVLCMSYVGLAAQMLAPCGSRAVHPARTSPWGYVIGIAFVTAAGLYTFYYFGFLLAVANIAALIWWLQAVRLRLGTWLRWLTAHLIAVALWSPWLPIFIRQALEPPVPPWRAEWEGIAATVQAAYTTLLTYMAGHLLDLRSSPWIGIGLVLFGLAVLGLMARATASYSISTAKHNRPSSIGLVALYLFAFGPPLLIILLSATVTPLFHPRYIFVFHTPFLILLAFSVYLIFARLPRVGAVLIALLFALSTAGIAHFQHQPAFRADDHRGAVAQIAGWWRPGDVILVNAGWAYRAFSVYWPTLTTVSRDSTQSVLVLPPPLGPRMRLQPETLTPTMRETLRTGSEVPLFYTGSLDGASTLGWNNPDADFYATDAQAVSSALSILADHVSTLHHYRLYDTVSDPDGFIRTQLSLLREPLRSVPVSGRDFLRLESYRLTDAPVSYPDISRQIIGFATDLSAEIPPLPEHLEAGSYLYLPVEIYPSAANTQTGTQPLGLSLRLLDETQRIAAQTDVSFHVVQNPEQAAQLRYFAYPALPLDLTLAPGLYTVEMVIYDQETLIPLAPDDETQRAPGGGQILGTRQVYGPTQPPLVLEELARFDYLGIISAHAQSDGVRAGSQWELNIITLPHASPYTDDYGLIVEWSGHASTSEVPAGALTWRAGLGPAAYPTGMWRTGFPIQRSLMLDIPASVQPGLYTVRLGIYRTADNLPITTRQWLGLRRHTWIPIDTIEVVSPP